MTTLDPRALEETLLAAKDRLQFGFASDREINQKVTAKIDTILAALSQPQAGEPAQVADAIQSPFGVLSEELDGEKAINAIEALNRAGWIITRAIAAIGAGGQAVAPESLIGQPYNPDDERFARLLDSQWRAGRTVGWNECFARYVTPSNGELS